jgi:hypothetical protein
MDLPPRTSRLVEPGVNSKDRWPFGFGAEDHEVMWRTATGSTLSPARQIPSKGLLGPGRPRGVATCDNWLTQTRWSVCLREWLGVAAVQCWQPHASRRSVKSTLLGGLRSAATCTNAGPHSGECEIHGKDGVVGSLVIEASAFLPTGSTASIGS